MPSEPRASDSRAGLERALATLASFAAPEELTLRISELEYTLASTTREQAADRLAEEHIDGSVLGAALTLKRLAGQVNVIVHAVGILTALPHVLEPGEVIESLSLGAGNTGRLHDLETDRRIAEFKFIEWRGGAESIRQNSLFVDLFNLATADTDKRRPVRRRQEGAVALPEQPTRPQQRAQQECRCRSALQPTPWRYLRDCPRLLRHRPRAGRDS